MFKFICLVLCVISLSGAYAGGDAFEKEVKPVLDKCSKKFDVTDDDIRKAAETANPASLNPCFVACIFKSFDIINDKGKYDPDTAITTMKNYVDNDELVSKIAAVTKECASINEKPVSDGEAGCDRAMLLASCFVDHKSMMMM